eukprot:gene37618-42607_t
MSTLLKALSLRTYGAGFLSSAFITHNVSRRTTCEPLSSTAGAASTASLANNPLMNKKSTPLFAEIRPEHILPAMQHDLASLKTGFADLETSLGTSKKPVDYSSVVEGLEVVQAPLSYSWGVVGHLMGVKNSEELRTAHDSIQPKVIEVN